MKKAISISAVVAGLAGAALFTAAPASAHDFTSCRAEINVFEDGSWAGKRVKAIRSNGTFQIAADRWVVGPGTPVITGTAPNRVLTTYWLPALSGTNNTTGQVIPCTIVLPANF